MVRLRGKAERETKLVLVFAAIRQTLGLRIQLPYSTSSRYAIRRYLLVGLRQQARRFERTATAGATDGEQSCGRRRGRC